MQDVTTVSQPVRPITTVSCLVSSTKSSAYITGQITFPILKSPPFKNRTQRPHGLRRGSAAARLLGLRVRIQPMTWVSVVSVVCCQVEIPASG